MQHGKATGHSSSFLLLCRILLPRQCSQGMQKNSHFLCCFHPSSALHLRIFVFTHSSRNSCVRVTKARLEKTDLRFGGALGALEDCVGGAWHRGGSRGILGDEEALGDETLGTELEAETFVVLYVVW